MYLALLVCKLFKSQMNGSWLHSALHYVLKCSVKWGCHSLGAWAKEHAERKATSHYHKLKGLSENDYAEEKKTSGKRQIAFNYWND